LLLENATCEYCTEGQVPSDDQASCETVKSLVKELDPDEDTPFKEYLVSPENRVKLIIECEMSKE